MFGWDNVEGRDKKWGPARDTCGLGEYILHLLRPVSHPLLFSLVSALPTTFSITAPVFFYCNAVEFEDHASRGIERGLGQHVQRGCAWVSSASSAQTSTCDLPPFLPITSPLAD